MAGLDADTDVAGGVNIKEGSAGLAARHTAIEGLIESAQENRIGKEVSVTALEHQQMFGGIFSTVVELVGAGLELAVGLDHQVGIMGAGQLDQLFHVLKVVVHQHGHNVDPLPAVYSGLTEIVQSLDGLVETSAFAAPAVVPGGVGIIDADRNTPQAGLHEFFSLAGRHI